MDRLEKKGTILPRFFSGALVMVAIIAVVFLSVSFYQDRFRSETAEPANGVGEILDEDDTLTTQTDISEEPEQTTEEPTESLSEEPVVPEQKTAFLTLSISATADTWMRVIIDGDGANKKDYSLKPGDTISLNAITQYNLLIGNAGGVQLTLNGQPVQVPGKMGQVVNLILP